MKFVSQNTVYYIEDDIITIAFADSKEPDPKQYLILQREIDNSEPYYYEVNSQEFSNDGGIKGITLTNNELILEFQSNERIYQAGIKSIKVSFTEDNALNRYIMNLFQDSDTIIY